MRIAALLVGIVAIVVGIGYALPVAHVAQRTLTLDRPVAEVWGVLTDFPGQVSWRKDVTSVVRDSVAERETWIEVSGGDAIPFETTESNPPARLVRTIADPALPFGGRWVYTLEATTTGTRLTIVEEGKIYNPVFRFVSHLFLNQAATIEGVMTGLAAHFGETPRITP